MKNKHILVCIVTLGIIHLKLQDENMPLHIEAWQNCLMWGGELHGRKAHISITPRAMTMW